jgi:hypothetical protein
MYDGGITPGGKKRKVKKLKGENEMDSKQKRKEARRKRFA